MREWRPYQGRCEGHVSNLPLTKEIEATWGLKVSACFMSNSLPICKDEHTSLGWRMHAWFYSLWICPMKIPWSLLPGFRQLTTSRIQGLMKRISAHQPVTFKTPPGLTKWIFWPFVRNMGNRACLISLNYCKFYVTVKIWNRKAVLDIEQNDSV